MYMYAFIETERPGLGFCAMGYALAVVMGQLGS